MKKLLVLAFAAMICLIIVVQVAQAAAPSISANKTAQTSQVLRTFNRTQVLQSLNKSATMEGFFCNSSTPILIENLDLIKGDAPLPPDKYIPLVGTIPTSLKLGAKVKFTGTVQKPGDEKLTGENISLVVTGQPTIVQTAPSNLLNPNLIAAVQGITVQPATGKRYALLIGGGKNGPNNYPRYWNDLLQMYHILLAAGYEPANIRVAYAGGFMLGPGMPVNYPATIPGIQGAFTYFVPKVKSNDTFYIMVSGQGATPGTIPGAPTAYWAWPGYAFTPSMFAAQVNRITSYKKITITMGQSFSGGFIPFLMRPNRIVITSAAANKDAYCHPSYYYGNFYYWYMSAFARRQLLGGTPVNADTNNNGHVSLAESYNCALPRPYIAIQMPMFEDTGALPSRWGLLPAAGEGAQGVLTYL